VNAGEVAEPEDLFDLFGEQPLEVHFDENILYDSNLISYKRTAISRAQYSNKNAIYKCHMKMSRIIQGIVVWEVDCGNEDIYKLKLRRKSSKM
jgi:hypothetical protein